MSVQNSRKNSSKFYLAMLGVTYISYSSTRPTHDLILKKKLVVHFGSEGCLVLPLLVPEFNEAECTQFKEKELAMHFGSLIWTPYPTSN